MLKKINLIFALLILQEGYKHRKPYGAACKNKTYTHKSCQKFHENLIVLDATTGQLFSSKTIQ